MQRRQGSIPVGFVPPDYAVQTGDGGRVSRGVPYPLDIYPRPPDTLPPLPKGAWDQ